MSGLEIILPIVFPVCAIITAFRLRKRRREIKRLEHILDENSIVYEPSNMRRRKKWFTFGKCRRYCKVEETTLLGQNVENWEEYH